MLVHHSHTLRVKLSSVNWTYVDVFIKMLLWVNAVLLEHCKCGPWKSLKSPWIWFLHLGKNPGEEERNWREQKRQSVMDENGWEWKEAILSRVWQSWVFHKAAFPPLHYQDNDDCLEDKRENYQSSVVYDSCAQWYAHCHTEQFLKLKVCLGLVILCLFRYNILCVFVF